VLSVYTYPDSTSQTTAQSLHNPRKILRSCTVDQRFKTPHGGDALFRHRPDGVLKRWAKLRAIRKQP